MFSWRHLIFCWWLELCSLLLLCLKSNCGKGNGSNGDLLQRAYVSIVICNDPDYGPMPQLKTPGHSQASLSQSSVGSLLLSPGSWYTQGFGCALKSFFPQSCGRSVIKSPCPTKSNSLEFSVPLVNLLVGKFVVGSRNFGEDNDTPLQYSCLENPMVEEPGGLQSVGSWRKWQPTPVFLPGASQGWGSLVGCHLWGRTESDMTLAAVAARTFATCENFFCIMVLQFVDHLFSGSMGVLLIMPQLPSFHMLKVMLKILQARLNSMWTENFQISCCI